MPRFFSTVFGKSAWPASSNWSIIHILVGSSSSIDPAARVLVCFAVKEEAKFFVTTQCERIITGMGVRNATKGIEGALSKNKPDLVLTTGFAGGLNPRLKTGSVVFEEDEDAGLRSLLTGLNATPVRFHCADRVAVTSAEKKALWVATGADVVEMESSIIRKVCRAQKIPSATIRVISDAADEDLPLDFNALMTPDERIDFGKLAWKLMCGPQKIPQLMQFQKRTIAAARNLADVLEKLLLARRR